MSSTAKLVGKSLNSPDEVRPFEKGRIETVTLGDSGVTIGRSTFEPVGAGKNVLNQLLKQIAAKLLTQRI